MLLLRPTKSQGLTSAYLHSLCRRFSAELKTGPRTYNFGSNAHHRYFHETTTWLRPTGIDAGSVQALDDYKKTRMYLCMYQVYDVLIHL